VVLTTLSLDELDPAVSLERDSLPLVVRHRFIQSCTHATNPINDGYQDIIGHQVLPSEWCGYMRQCERLQPLAYLVARGHRIDSRTVHVENGAALAMGPQICVMQVSGWNRRHMRSLAAYDQGTTGLSNLDQGSCAWHTVATGAIRR